MSQRGIGGKVPEEASVSLARLAQVLAPWCPVPQSEIAIRIAAGLTAWAADKKPKALRTTLTALAYWGRYWLSFSGDVNPLSEEGLSRYGASLLDEGLSTGLVLQRLSAIYVACHCIGLVSPELRVALRKARSPYTERKHRRERVKTIPMLAADLRRLILAADPHSPKDVRNVVAILILYEGMATFKELVGMDVPHSRLDVGTMITDLRFEAGGTCLLRLYPSRPEDAGRTIRLSSDATAWIRHWLAMRGPRSGHLLAFWPPEGSGYKVLARTGKRTLWRGPKQFQELATRHGIPGEGLTASSLRLGRAVAMLDAGYSLSQVAEAGRWSSAARLAWALDVGLTLRRGVRASREPLRLTWPRPQVAPTENPAPQQQFAFPFAA